MIGRCCSQNNLSQFEEIIRKHTKTKSRAAPMHVFKLYNSKSVLANFVLSVKLFRFSKDLAEDQFIKLTRSLFLRLSFASIKIAV